MIIVLFLLAYDSLPPLPDLSQVIFPEPPLWIEQKEDYLYLSGFAGEFYGGDCNIELRNSKISVFYKDGIDWDTTKHGEIKASYSMPLPHFWMQPALYGYMLERNDKYRLISPQFQFSSTVPWSIIFGSINLDFWQINGANNIEEEGKLGIIFDNTIYLPHFEIAGFYTNEKLKPKFTGKLHIRSLHLSIASPLFYSFPSPTLEIQYLEPMIKIATEIKSGEIYKSLKNYLNAEMPIRYRIPIPEESLKVGISFNFKLDLHKHYLSLHSNYKNWYCRLVTGSDFHLNTIQDIQEANIGLTINNNFHHKYFWFSNTLHLNYNWADNEIPFLAQYALYDTCTIDYRIFSINLETNYFSDRQGVFARTLPRILIISPAVGLKYRFLRIFLSIYNLTDIRREIFDNYFLHRRQYAGGIELTYKF